MQNNTTNKIFIKIKSQDELVNRYKSQIEKLSLMWLWVAKAHGMVQAYLHDLHSGDHITDPVQRGRIMQSCESHFMAAVSLFLRCFLDQPSTHLQIDEVTQDKELLDCFDELMALRNDEFVHWKGVRSGVEVTYSFEMLNERQAEMAKEFGISINEKIGPGELTHAMEKLFKATQACLDIKREAIMKKLRLHLQKEEVMAVTDFLNECGHSILKRS